MNLFLIAGIIILVLLICVFLFIWFFNKGADSRKINDWFRNQEDDEQERLMSELLQKKSEKKQAKEN